MQVYFSGCYSFGKQGILYESVVARNEYGRFCTCGFNHFYIAKRFHTNIRNAPLRCSAELTGTAQFQIELGKFEAIGGVFEGMEP